jgi:acyl-CoA thioester hydrolase
MQETPGHITAPLRWRDMDMLGHLNQAVYHELLEESRFSLLDAVATASGGGHGMWVLVHVEIDYRHEVRRDDGSVTVISRVDELGGSSIRMAHEVRLPDGTVAATGAAVMVAWDPEARGKRAMTDAERAAWESLRVEG